MRGRPRRGLAIASLVVGAQLPRVGGPARRRCARHQSRWRRADGAQVGRAHAPRGPVSEAEALRPRPDLPPAERALVVIGAVPAQAGSRPSPVTQQVEERWIDAEAAESAGYTLVDLSDDWTPYIFAEQTGPDGQPLPNRYRRIFVGLANDQLDEDGEPLRAGGQELPRALRHLPVAVGAAGALRRRRAAPLPGPGERRRARRRRDGHLRRAGRRQEGRAPPGPHPRRAGDGAQEGARGRL